jgi:chaperonin cofactor prefoldin
VSKPPDPKPMREWWIKEAFVGKESGTRYPSYVGNEDNAKYEKGFIHVIEYAAITHLEASLNKSRQNCDEFAVEKARLEAELKEARGELDAFKEHHQITHDCYADAVKERDALCTELKEAKEYTTELEERLFL